MDDVSRRVVVMIEVDPDELPDLEREGVVVWGEIDPVDAALIVLDLAGIAA